MWPLRYAFQIGLSAVMQWIEAGGWESGTSATADGPRRNVLVPRQHARTSCLNYEPSPKLMRGRTAQALWTLSVSFALEGSIEMGKQLWGWFRRVKRRWKMEMHLALRSDFRSWFCLLIRIGAKTFGIVNPHLGFYCFYYLTNKTSYDSVFINTQNISLYLYNGFIT